MANILLVEDDPSFRKALTDLLKKKGHNVTTAGNGKVAIGHIKEKKFEMVISDIQMPEMNGIELLKWASINYPVPFIIMTGFSTLLETHTAYELGAQEFISKPFKSAEFITVINKVLGRETKLTLAEGDQSYCRLLIDEFVSGKKVEFDIYVKLSESKYVKIAHKGEDISKERILHYKERGVRYLYITKDGFSQLVGFNLELAGLIQTNKNVSTEKKVNFLKYTGEVIMAKAFVGGVDREVFAQAQTFVNLTMNALTESQEYLDLLDMLNSHSDLIYAHSIGVALYSFMIAKGMGFESNQAFFKLSMAAMFHDVGKKEITNDLLDKPRVLLNAEEKKLIDSHVIRGQEILLSIKGIPEGVAQLVYEHHEDIAGLGYPMGCGRTYQHPLSPILQLANLFVGLALADTNSQGMSGADAIKHIEERYAGRFDDDAMAALKMMFKEPK
jgi:putative nucleotidyltransferase with HDIG domain